MRFLPSVLIKSFIFLKNIRLGGWVLVSIALAAVIWLLAPQQLPVTLYKISLITAGGVLGYWLDRSLFPYARPDHILTPEGLTTQSPRKWWPPVKTDENGLLYYKRHLFAFAMIRRAIIVAAVILAVGLGA